MAKLQKIYADLDLTFRKVPGTNDVALRYDDQAVVSAIRYLLMTNFHERPFQPTLGSNMNAMLFEPSSGVMASMLKDEISNVISNFETRATINEIMVNTTSDGQGFSISLSVFIGNNTTPTNISLLLQRTR